MELDRLRYESWLRVGRDVRNAGTLIAHAALIQARLHPGLLVGGGALVGLMVLSRLRRKPIQIVTGRPSAGHGVASSLFSSLAQSGLLSFVSSKFATGDKDDDSEDDIEDELTEEVRADEVSMSN